MSYSYSLVVRILLDAITLKCAHHYHGIVHSFRGYSIKHRIFNRGCSGILGILRPLACAIYLAGDLARTCLIPKSKSQLWPISLLNVMGDERFIFAIGIAGSLWVCWGHQNANP